MTPLARRCDDTKQLGHHHLHSLPTSGLGQGIPHTHFFLLTSPLTAPLPYSSATHLLPHLASIPTPTSSAHMEVATVELLVASSPFTSCLVHLPSA